MTALKKAIIASIALFAAAAISFAADLNVVKAVYGADSTWADVTDKVKAKVADGKLSVEATNDNFGDPLEGTQKFLKVTVSYKGKELVFQADENATLEITQAALEAASAKETAAPAASGNLEIVKAVYGAESTWADVTEKVKAKVANGKLSVEASNDNFGDPLEGTQKFLKVNYKLNGKELEKQADENATLEIP